jgi:hypothetical protein
MFRIACDLENNLRKVDLPQVSTSVYGHSRSGTASADGDEASSSEEQLPQSLTRRVWFNTKECAMDWWHALTNTRRLDNMYLLPYPPSTEDSAFTSFCKAVSNIEELRERTLAHLQV